MALPKIVAFLHHNLPQMRATRRANLLSPARRRYPQPPRFLPLRTGTPRNARTAPKSPPASTKSATFASSQPALRPHPAPRAYPLSCVGQAEPSAWRFRRSQIAFHAPMPNRSSLSSLKNRPTAGIATTPAAPPAAANSTPATTPPANAPAAPSSLQSPDPAQSTACQRKSTAPAASAGDTVPPRPWRPAAKSLDTRVPDAPDPSTAPGSPLPPHRNDTAPQAETHSDLDAGDTSAATPDNHRPFGCGHCP